MNIKEILFKHKLWLEDNPEGVRADLREADLYGADLYGANLQWANLQGANLRKADLRGANLQMANLQVANLQGADLQGAYLREANLRGANLQMANLREANLRGANLREADLRRANLQGANLPHFQLCPEEGSFIACKKLTNGVIAKLEIPADAKRTSSLVGRKCRAEFVKVLELSNGASEAISTHDSEFVYRVGEIVRPDKYDDDIRIECTSGIHFFMTRKEAEDY